MCTNMKGPGDTLTPKVSGTYGIRCNLGRDPKETGHHSRKPFCAEREG